MRMMIAPFDPNNPVSNVTPSKHNALVKHILTYGNKAFAVACKCRQATIDAIETGSDFCWIDTIYVDNTALIMYQNAVIKSKKVLDT